MTDMTEIIERANSAGFRVMEDARYGKPDECVDWEGVFDRVADTIIATLAAGMAEAGLKVVRDCPECAAMIAAGPMKGYDLEYEGVRAVHNHCYWWKGVFDNTTCQFQRVMKGEG